MGSEEVNVLTAGAKRDLLAEYHARYPIRAVIETGIWQLAGPK